MNTPHPDPLIGRDTDMTTVIGLLNSHHTVTIIGTGGVGKTRLAEALTTRTSRPTIWVDLRATPEPGAIPAALAEAANIPAPTSIDALARALTAREALLVLDNCENLTPALRPLLDKLAQPGRQLRTLCTSRWAIGHDTEATYELPPLTTDTATQLLERRITEHHPSTAPTGHTPGLTHLAERTGGLPLAIEILAAWAAIYTPTEVEQRLPTAFSATTRPGEQSFHDVMDFTWAALTDTQQTVFRRLHVFPTAFTLPAAEAVCTGGSLPETAIAPSLIALTRANMVTTIPTRDGKRVFRLLEPVRHYAATKADHAGETHTVRQRHATWITRTITHAANNWYGPQETSHLKHGSRIRPDIATALAHYLASDQPDQGINLVAQTVRLRLCFHTGRFASAHQWLERFLTNPKTSHPARTLGHAAACYLATCRGQATNAAHHLTQARQHNPINAETRIMLGFAQTAYNLFANPNPTSVAHSTRLYNDTRRLDPTVFAGDAAMAQLWNAMDSIFHADPAVANTLTHAFLRDTNAAQAPLQQSWARWARSLYLLIHQPSAIDTAENLMRQSIDTQRNLGDRWGSTWNVLLSAAIAAQQQDWETTAHRGGTINGMADTTHLSLPGLVGLFALLDTGQTQARQHLGETRYRQLHDTARARAHNYEQALAETVVPGLTRLTTRETEILGLLARGDTNNRIAKQLVISGETAAKHLTSIYRKTGLSRDELRSFLTIDNTPPPPADETGTAQTEPPPVR